MTEHHPRSTQPLSTLIDPRGCVTLPAIPTVYGLRHPEDGVTAWVFALPDGQALIMPSRGDTAGVIHTSLDLVERCWAPLRDAQLVLVHAA